MAGLGRSIFFVEVKEKIVREVVINEVSSVFLPFQTLLQLLLYLSCSLQAKCLKVLSVFFVLLPHLVFIPPQPVTNLDFAS